jgi:hypothetical protein
MARWCPIAGSIGVLHRFPCAVVRVVSSFLFSLTQSLTDALFSPCLFSGLFVGLSLRFFLPLRFFLSFFFFLLLNRELD